MELTLPFNRIKTIPWSEIYTYIPVEFTTLKIKPDRCVNNHKIVDLMSALCDMRLTREEQLTSKWFRITLREQNRWGWTLDFGKDYFCLYLHVPKYLKNYVIQKAQSKDIWPACSITECEDILPLDPVHTSCAEIALRHHDIFSLHVDHKEVAPMPSLCNILTVVDESDRVRVNMAYEPVERESWAYRTAGAHKALKEGKLPTKFHWDKRAAFRQVGLLMTSALSEFLGIVNTIIAPNHPLPYQKPTAADRMRILLDNGGKLSQSTLDKSHEPVAKGFIRIACESQSQSQALMLCRAVSQSFRDLDGDNEFIRMNIPQKKVRRFLMDMERNRVPSIGGSTFSVGELATLHRLPTGPLQDLYPQINNIDTRENAIPEVLRSGIPIGYGKYRGLTILVCRPTHNRDDLLLPWALFGGSGWGKTTSLANLALELVLLGYTVFHIDVSGGQALFDVINHLPESVPGDHIHMRDYNHGVYMPSVAWTEPGAYMQDSENPRRVANSLTGALKDFLIQTTDEQGNQTGNLLSALCLAAFSTYPGSLMHVVKCATSEKVCRECMQNLENPFALQVLNDYWSLSDNMRANNFRPVMSRLGQLLSDENISSAMLQEPVLDADGKPATDYRRWSDEGGHYVPINVPSDPSALGKIAADQITALEAHKVFLSVLTRPLPEQSRKPAFLLLDEPHQFPSVMAVFSRILLEGRKHGLGCITAFHDWRLVPKNFRSSFLAATCNYAAMKCSKDMLDDIGDAFRPFDDREIMELPKYHAVLRMVANGQDQTPLLVKLIEPPSQRYQFVDRSARIEECARTYGRPITEIQQWIYEQYMQAQTETKPKGRR